VGLPMWSGSALPGAAPGSGQPGALAGCGGPVNEQRKRLDAHDVPLGDGDLGDQPAGPDEPAASRWSGVTVHGPLLPTWVCGTCDAPWPCSARKCELRTEFDGDRVPLALYLAAHFVRAAADLVGFSAGSLYRRFLGWVR
jgi:hypothetical protein